mgnify:FL=1
MSPSPRYASLSIALHWLMLVLLVAVYACIELRELFPRGSEPRELIKTWHFMLGMLVLVLVTARLWARWRHAAPPISPALPRWQNGLAQLMHLALYALMIGMPIGGWLILSAEGKPVPFFGLTLPPLTGVDPTVAELVEEIHETAGVVGYWLIGLHAAAGLAHHYLQRDNTLRRMLPAGRNG